MVSPHPRSTVEAEWRQHVAVSFRFDQTNTSIVKHQTRRRVKCPCTAVTSEQPFQRGSEQGFGSNLTRRAGPQLPILFSSQGLCVHLAQFCISLRAQPKTKKSICLSSRKNVIIPALSVRHRHIGIKLQRLSSL
jgi:hypothetical protein